MHEGEKKQRLQLGAGTWCLPGAGVCVSDAEGVHLEANDPRTPCRV